ncbi:MAG: DUF1800 family protein [Planctomycetes bacterium]|nr:DUF1800 family protein [Planctomycetota bacterium]
MNQHRLATRAVFVLSTLVATTAIAQIPPIQDYQVQAGHMMRRLAFGPKASEYAAISSQTDVDQWVLTQLAGNQAVPADLTNLVAALATIPPSSNPRVHDWTITELRQYAVAWALFSPNQLREKLTVFWSQHFNTSQGRVDNFYKNKWTNDAIAADVAVTTCWKQYEDFRANALGTFKDLLSISMNSSPMRIYLHTTANHKSNPEPNEDYSRELLELHSLSPESATGAKNYDQTDIQKLARFMTGLFVDENENSSTGGILNDANAHDFAQLDILSLTGTPISIPSNLTMNARLDLLVTELAKHPETIDHVCRRLLRFFAHDWEPSQVPTAILNAMKAQWGLSGDITAVVQAMVTHPKFNNNARLWKLIKTPLESEVSIQRMFDKAIYAANSTSTSALLQLSNRISNAMPQQMFTFPSPDGYSIVSTEQTDVDMALQRLIGPTLVYTGNQNLPSTLSVADLFSLLGNVTINSTAGDIATATLMLFYQNHWDVGNHADCVDILNSNPDGSSGGPLWSDVNITINEKRDRLEFLAYFLAGLTQNHTK